MRCALCTIWDLDEDGISIGRTRGQTSGEAVDAPTSAEVLLAMRQVGQDHLDERCRWPRLAWTRSKLVQSGPDLLNAAPQLRVGFVRAGHSPGSRSLDELMQLPETLC